MAGNTKERGKRSHGFVAKATAEIPATHRNGENENAHPLIDVGAFGCDPTKNGRPSGGVIASSEQQFATPHSPFALVTFR